MPQFDISFLRLAPDKQAADAMHLTVDWPFLPREGESISLDDDFEPAIIESVGYGPDGYPLVSLGRVHLDDLQVAQLRKAGWRVTRIPRDRA